MLCSRSILQRIWPQHDHPVGLTALGPMDGESDRGLQTPQTGWMQAAHLQLAFWVHHLEQQTSCRAGTDHHPEVAIVGPNKIAERVVVKDGQMVVRKMMNLSSSFDHRIVDGHDAAVFVQRIKGLLEHPATLWMN